MKTSILKNDRKGVCFMCKRYTNTERHHIFGGSARKKSEMDCLTVYLCHWCHNEPPRGVHQNRENDIYLKRMAQLRWMEFYGKTEEQFRERYGKSWL